MRLVDPGEEASCGGVLVLGWGDGDAAGVEDRLDVVDRVPEGAAADAEQFGEDVEGADAASVEDGREDPVTVGDLLLEDAAGVPRRRLPPRWR
ncbi:hypothetical protein OG310_36680 (plasmid) [Streptomyces sp. NBC_01497]|nr:hypothetical protein [Streptomyces sp. NBC_01497]